MALTVKVVEWKSVGLVAGERCVMKDGTEMMLSQHADNWDLKQLVPSQSEVPTLVKVELIDLFRYRKLNAMEHQNRH